MPIDMTKPLECNRPEYREVVEVLPETETTIVVRIRDRYGRVYSYSFNKDTLVLQGREADDNAIRLRNKSEEVANHYYRIWFGHRDWPKENWRYLGDDRQYQFDTGKAAAEACKAWNVQSREEGDRWKFMVKSHIEMSPNHNWRQWMQDRFDNGEYLPCPWQEEEWYNKDHFTHCSLSDPFRVAYVDNPMDGVNDKMTVLTAGRYLQKFYSDKLSASEIASWVTKMDSEAELKFATTPEEFIRVYTESGISSCMQYRTDHFASNPYHPVSVYAAGDLELAYLERRGKVVGRCLVMRSNMKYGRIYGNEERLRPRLIELGFSGGGGDPNTFNDARLTKIEIAGDVVMPYLDWDMRAKDNPDDPHTMLLCGPNDRDAKYNGKSTNGLSTGQSPAVCPQCSARFIPTGDSRYLSRMGRAVCPTCVSDMNVLSCSHCGNHDTEEHMMPHYDGITNEPVLNRRGGQLWVCRYSCIGNSRSYVAYEGRAYSRYQTNYDSRDCRVPLFVIQRQQEEEAAAKAEAKKAKAAAKKAKAEAETQKETA